MVKGNERRGQVRRAPMAVPGLRVRGSFVLIHLGRAGTGGVTGGTTMVKGK